MTANDVTSRASPQESYNSQTGANSPTLTPLSVTANDVTNRASPQESYNPQTEAISPTLPADGLDESPLRSTKDELLRQISTIDREIMKAESQIAKLKRKQVRDLRIGGLRCTTPVRGRDGEVWGEREVFVSCGQ